MMGSLMANCSSHPTVHSSALQLSILLPFPTVHSSYCPFYCHSLLSILLPFPTVHSTAIPYCPFYCHSLLSILLPFPTVHSTAILLRSTIPCYQVSPRPFFVHVLKEAKLKVLKSHYKKGHTAKPTNCQTYQRSCLCNPVLINHQFCDQANKIVLDRS